MFSKIVSSVSSAFDFNLATLSGCIDIIVVPKENGDLQSTPFHVRFGKAKLLRSREKIVDVTVNWEPTGLKMTLGSAGEAYFIVRDDRTDLEIEQDRARRMALLTGEEDDLDSEHFFGADLSSVHQWSPGEEEAVDTLDEVEVAELETETIGPSVVSPEALQQRSLESSLIVSEKDVHRQFDLVTDRRAPTDIEVSLCGHLLYGLPSESAHDVDVFQANLLDWDKLNEEPHLWFHPSIVFRFGEEPPYFPAKTALPLISSWAMFGRSLSKEAFVTLLKGQLKFKDSRDPFAQIQLQAQDILNPIEPPPSILAHRRHRSLTPTAAPYRLTPSRLPNFITTGFNCCAPHEEEVATTFGKVDRASAAEPVLANTLQKLASGEENVLPVDESTLMREVSQRHTSESPGLLAVTTDRQSSTRRLRRFRKSLKPSADQLRDLNLKPGPNAITFSVSSPLQGTKTVTGTIYLWPRNAKIVVSDVDGTITRSDLWGQLMPIVGRDWSHPGVAELFSNIRNSDYKILYLTARAIGQADSTRDYLFGLTQNQRNKLPDGPLILSPDRLFPSFKREVIDRKPYVFKIAALRDIRNLFPPFYNPFYSGFGNRDTDHRAYVHVGIPEARIFIIDPTGHVHHVNKTYAKTYESMSSMAAEMFPPLNTSIHEEHPVDDQVSFARALQRETLIRDRKLLRHLASYERRPPAGFLDSPRLLDVKQPHPASAPAIRSATRPPRRERIRRLASAITQDDKAAAQAKLEMRRNPLVPAPGLPSDDSPYENTFTRRPNTRAPAKETRAQAKETRAQAKETRAPVKETRAAGDEQPESFEYGYSAAAWKKVPRLRDALPAAAS